MKTKPIQIGAEQIKSYQIKWNQLVKEAKKILVIGVKPNSEDNHIWEALDKTDAKLGFIGSQIEYNHWVQTQAINSSSFLGSGWNDSFDAGIHFLTSN